MSLPATRTRICPLGRLLTRAAPCAEHCERMEVIMVPSDTLPEGEAPGEDPDKGLLMIGAIAGAVVLVVLLAVFFGVI